MTWYKYALRKHYLRIDPRVFLNLEINDPNLDAYGTSFVVAGIIKGLDVLGLTAFDVNVPLKIKTSVANSNLDIYLLTGQVLKTSDDYNIIVYGYNQNIQTASLAEILKFCQQNNLISMIFHLGKQKAKQLKNLTEKINIKPTLVEIFNAQDKGYLYITTNTFEVVSSGLDNIRDFEKTNIFSLIQRKDLEEMKIISPGQGSDYTPRYLQENL